MKIGELARRAGVTASRMRFYEERGLLPPAARRQNGYRDYGERDVKVIAFIERAQKLGFSLREITAFLDRPQNERSAEGLLPSLKAKLAEIDAHLVEVEARRGEVIRLIEEIGAR